MKKLLLLTLFVMFPTLLGAQTISAALQWTHPTDLVTVQGYSFLLKADASAAAVVPATCVATSPTLTTCTTPLVISLNAPHTIILAACTSTCVSATLNYTPPPSPVPPGNVKTVITITWP